MNRDANPDGPKVLAQFLRDWTNLWREEVQAQGNAPSGAGMGSGLPPDMTAAMELWRTTMTAWAQTLNPPPAAVGSRDRSTASRPEAAAAAPDPRDVEVERLTRRVDELEARLAKLETPRRRRS